MDRSMAWAQHQHHRRGHSLGGGRTTREKDEDLALFKDMGKRDKPPFLHPSTVEDQLLDASLSTKFGGLSHPHSAPPVERKGIGAELLNSDADKTDYDWLMTPPGTPLFPSLDADSPALQQGALINRSLAAIKTSRVGTAPRAKSPAPNMSRGNPSPSRRPSTPLNGQQSTAGMRPLIPAKHATNNRPATPPRSSTPTSRASPNVRPSTPTRQTTTPAPARPVTPLGARPATPTRTTTNSTPTLRRSTSSPTGSSNGPPMRNPSPTRSTASTRGISPARSGPSRGVSPVRGVSPAPTTSSRGRSPSPSLRAPYPVDASDDIPPNLRTTSDRPSSAQRRALAYGANPGEGRVDPLGRGDPHPLRRTPSPARTSGSRASRAASSDSESSFDTCSQSGVSTHGLLTPERSGSRGRVFGRGTSSVDYGRSSSLQQKPRRSSSTTSPQLGSSASKKSFESAAREYHRGQVTAFRPLMTNSSISTFYSSRASGLLRRPLTPSSTASSSEHGATVAHDSELDDEDAGSSHWKPSHNASHASGAHSPLHLFDKSLHDTGTSSIVDNDELSTFFQTPEALRVESIDFKPVSSQESQELVLHSAELNWLNNSRTEHDMDRDYLRSRDVKDVDINNNNHADGQQQEASKQGPSGLEKIRDKLRHLKSTAENNEEADKSASRVSQQAQTVTDSLCSLRAANALEISVVDRDMVGSPTTTATSQPVQVHEGSSGTPEGSTRTNVENAETGAKERDNMVYGKERDIWYIYRHSSEYEVPVAGFSETKMEIDPPQILAKEVHMRASRPANHDLSSRGTKFSPRASVLSCEREGTRSPTVMGHKENVPMEKVFPEVPCGEFSTSNLAEGGNGASLRGKEVDGGHGAAGADTERKGLLEVGLALNRRIPSSLSEPIADVGARSEPMQQQSGSSESGAVQNILKQAPYEPERANQIDVEQSDKDCKKPLHMSSEPPQNSQMRPALLHSSSATHRATVVNPMSQSFEAEKEPEILGQVEYGVDAQASEVSPLHSSPNSALNAEEHSHFIRTESLSSSRPAKEEASSDKGLLPMHAPPVADSACSSTEAQWNEDRASVIPQVKKIIWQEEDLQPQTLFGTRPEAGTVHSRADEHERTCREGDEAELGWETGKVEDMFFVAGYPVEGSVESQRQVALTHGPKGVKSKPTRTDDAGSFYFEPLELVGLKYLLTGQIHIESVLYATVHLSDDSLVIKVRSSDGRVLALDNPARLISEPDDVTSYAVYEYSHWAEVGEQLTFSAHHGRENSSSEILFYPREHHVHVTPDEKQPRIPAFQGRPGMHVKGSVVPAQDGGSKSGEIAASTTVTGSDGAYVSAPVYDDTKAASAGFHPSRQRNPELLPSNAPDARNVMKATTQPEAGVPAFGVENDGNAKTGLQGLIQVLGNSTSHNCELLELSLHAKEVGTDVALDQRLGAASPDEMTSTADHFDYIFESKRDNNPRSPQPAEPPMPGASTTTTTSTTTSLVEIPTSARIIDATNKPPSTSNGVNNQPHGTTTPTKGSSAQAKTTLPRSPSSIRDYITIKANNKNNNSRAAADSAPVKEEIVESAESPSPGTRKHMSSFKFSHKKSSPTQNSELKRSSTTFGMQSDSGSSQKKNHKTSDKHAVNGKPGASSSSTTPHLSKGRSVRAASPARPLAATTSPSVAKAKPCPPAAAAAAAASNGETVTVVAPGNEEPSIHSRFSNITVRSGSDTEIFDWGPSSLEETSSRCCSSAGTNAASMAVLNPNSALPLLHGDNMANEDHDDDEEYGECEEDNEKEEYEEYEEEQCQQDLKSPLRRSADDDMSSVASSSAGDSSVSARSSLANLPRERDPRDPRAGSLVMNPAVRPVRCGPASSSSTSTSHAKSYAPKQNLDKLSEKLEQLETFGARVLLRNPQQQFLHSPPHHGPTTTSTDCKQPHHNFAAPSSLSFRSRSRRTLSTSTSSRSRAGEPTFSGATPLHVSMSASKPNNWCRCTIL